MPNHQTSSPDMCMLPDSSSGGSSYDYASTYAPECAPGLYVNDPYTSIPTNDRSDAVDMSNGDVALSYLQQMCPEGGVGMDPTNGQIFMDPEYSMMSVDSEHANTCNALGDMVNSGNMWSIDVNDEDWPHTRPDDQEHGGDHGVSTGGVVTAPSPNSNNLWGAATEDGDLGEIPPWLVLAHELLGHAWLMDNGEQHHDVERGRGGHQDTVARENMVRDEHGLPRRGTYLDPHCGESFWRDRDDPAEVNWSSAHGICEAARNADGNSITDDLD